MSLPPNVRVKHSAYHYDLGRDKSGQRRWKKLCRVSEGEQALYAAIAALKPTGDTTLSDIFNLCLAKGMDALAERTRRDHGAYINGNLRRVFGRTRPDDVHAGHIAQYLQRRLEHGGGIVANREIACLSSVYNLAMRRGLARGNPCRGVRRNPQPPRQRYVRDDEFRRVFETAPQEFQDFLAALYLTGFRQRDLRQLKKNRLAPQGIRVQESKTGKLRIVKWSEALRFFITRASSRSPKSKYVFTNSKGDPWSRWAIQSAVRRLRAKTQHDWTLHDVRAKAESDHAEGLGLLPLYRRATRVTPVR